MHSARWTPHRAVDQHPSNLPNLLSRFSTYTVVLSFSLTFHDGCARAHTRSRLALALLTSLSLSLSDYSKRYPHSVTICVPLSFSLSLPLFLSLTYTQRYFTHLRYTLPTRWVYARHNASLSSDWSNKPGWP